MNIGDKIKQRRMELKWSQRDLAAKMGYSQHTTITRIENGKIDISQSKVVKFSEVLGVSIEWLMNWEEEQKKNDTMSDIVVRMRSDDDFLSIVEKLNHLDSEQLKGIDQILTAFLK